MNFTTILLSSILALGFYNHNLINGSIFSVYDEAESNCSLEGQCINPAYLEVYCEKPSKDEFNNIGYYVKNSKHNLNVEAGLATIIGAKHMSHTQTASFYFLLEKYAECVLDNQHYAPKWVVGVELDFYLYTKQTGVNFTIVKPIDVFTLIGSKKVKVGYSLKIKGLSNYVVSQYLDVPLLGSIENESGLIDLVSEIEDLIKAVMDKNNTLNIDPVILR